MKFSPTVPLALVLAVGVAAAAAAQSTPSTSIEPQPAKPQAGSLQGQQGYNDNKAKATINKDMSTTEMKSTQTKVKPAAQMKGTETKVKPTAEMKTAQPRAKRIAHVKATHATANRTAMIERPAGPTANFTPDQVKAAQEQLHASGLYNGPTDGLMDPDTRAAIARFQLQNGMRRTDTLDRQTLARLNSGQTTGFGSSAAPGAAPAPTGAGGNTTEQPANR